MNESKQWDLDFVRQRFTVSDLSIAELAKLGNRSIEELKETSEKEKWEDLRKEHRREIQRLAVQRIAKRQSAEIEKIENEYLDIFAMARGIARAGLEAQYDNLLHNQELTKEEAWQDFDTTKYKNLITSITLAAEKESKILGLQYINDINKAVTLLIEQGFTVIPPTPKNESKEPVQLSLPIGGSEF